MIRAILRGLRYSDRYGSHPGTPILIAFVLMGGIAAQSWVGAAMMLVVFGPLYLFGAYERGKGEPTP